ncbi:MAG: glycosyl transferase family 1 [Winogradskyella sp.]|uniref:glycosyltransferase family 4 protein n=1 Tax=Winogradskyella sp. TaxID=1883156 RepID=UPI000F40B1AC|nr:glycosyltransferase family 4 protein [Winogradskyella sp.]RNC86310.1 MAG: glycosyl transferase family 1 [Winogradskyella sp.]
MATQKVLIVTYYWPPAGGPGVQRWLKFVKYLNDFDIEPIVYCPSNPNYPITDSSLINDVPKDVTIIKQPISEPYQFANLLSKKKSKTISSGVIADTKNQSFVERFLLYIRGNFFIPDARKNWIKPSVRFLSAYVVNNEIDTIITTGPPHSMHLIGLQLKHKLTINWIADFRDPWTTIGYHKSLKLTESSKRKHLALEKSVLHSADMIIVTSSNTKSEFEAKTDTSIEVITNGYDVNEVRIDKKDDEFTIAHIGSLLSERNPTILWEVLSELINENQNFADKFKLNLVGVVGDSIIKAIKAHGLENHCNLVGYVNHDEAIAFQKKSQLLLLIEIDSEDTKAIIPGKLFEYMVSKTPILAIGPKDSDIEGIINTTNTGSYLLYSEKEKLKAQILTYFESFKTGNQGTKPVGLENYSRKALTESLANLIKSFSQP